jgi:5-methylcytosine-specific restriction enzyme A
MPIAAPKPCGHPGCGALVRDGSGRCEKHPRKAWVRKPQAAVRTRGRKLQALRAELFRRNPLCVACEAKGITRLATERDHIKPLAEGGTDTEDNVQGLCKPCHEGKSLQEALRARTRG